MISYNSSVLTVNNGWLNAIGSTDANPYNLPHYTVRFQFTNSALDPNSLNVSDGTWTQVSTEPNIWDYTKTSNTSVWTDLFNGILTTTNLGGYCYVLGANLEYDITRLPSGQRMFKDCTGLLRVLSYIDMAHFTTQASMFEGCTNLQACPNLLVMYTYDVSRMYYGCTNVSWGIKDAYNWLSQHSCAMYFYDCFTNCGTNTQSGVNELHTVATDWGGTLPIWTTFDSLNVHYIADSINSIQDYLGVFYDGSTRPVVNSGFYRYARGKNWSALSSSEIDSLNNGTALYMMFSEAYFNLALTTTTDLDLKVVFTPWSRTDDGVGFTVKPVRNGVEGSRIASASRPSNLPTGVEYTVNLYP